MPCFHPLKALRSSGGVTVLPSDARVFNLQLPCGKCYGCRLERSRQWALRCVHEAQLYEQNSFVTLTYDDEHLPHDHGLFYPHFQAFIRELRRVHSPLRIRYYMCGEYGDGLGRPHYHACLFNYAPSDCTLWSKSPSGSRLFRSAEVERIWGKGFCTVGALTFESAAYAARYVMKKMTGDIADKHYSVVSSVTGEIHSRTPEFNKMSLKPGIGAGWFQKFSSDVFPHDHVVLNGSPSKPPRYYDKMLKASNPELHETIKATRASDAQERYLDNRPDRLSVREAVKIAQTSSFKRTLK